MSRYRCILLGHEEKMIQRTLDALPDEHRINSIVVVGGVNVLAIVDSGYNGTITSGPWIDSVKQKSGKARS